jgi:2,3-bisphosphoglycerate-independent phosphoglycerate mutase
MDGIGIGAGDESDAVASAYTPTLDWLRALPGSMQICAHGKAVGMPSDEDMGNSEVGHNALGAGRVFAQGAKLVSAAIATGAVFSGEGWQRALEKVRKTGHPLHFLGLLSDGNIHSHIDHLLAFVAQAAKERIAKVRVHILTDGRDVDGRSALRYIDRLEQALAQANASGLDYRIASGGGRMLITMDRYEADWGMVERGWNVHVRGEGRRFRSATEAVETLYAQSPDVNDQWLEGFVIADEHGPVGRIEDGAALILTNFRGDRAIEISRAFDDEAFAKFARGPRPDVYYAGMMEYDGDLHIPRNYLVAPPQIDRTMGELLAASGKRQLAIAETHKYGHVTYFWNGNRSGQFAPELETYIEIPSDLDSLEFRPWMKACEVTDRLVTELKRSPYDMVRVNYANGDMIGHTGDLRSTRISVEAVDLCLARLVAATREHQGILVVTADHGNADQMFETKGGKRIVKNSHTLNPVPFAIYDPRMHSGGPRTCGHTGDAAAPGLANVAATVLELMGLQAPQDYAPSLLRDET